MRTAVLPTGTHVRPTADGTTLSDQRNDPCDLGVQHGLPTHRASYRLSIDATRSAKDCIVGSRASAVWMLSADHVPGTEFAHFPLSVVRFTPKLSLTSTAKAGARLTVPIRIQGPAAAKGAVKSIAVQVSYDGGRTWKRVTVTTGATHARRAIAGLVVRVGMPYGGGPRQAAQPPDAAQECVTHSGSTGALATAVRGCSAQMVLPR